MRTTMLISALAVCGALASGAALAQATGGTGTAITPQTGGASAGVALGATKHATQAASQQQATSHRATPQNGSGMSNHNSTGTRTDSYSSGHRDSTTRRTNSTTETASASSSGH